MPDGPGLFARLHERSVWQITGAYVVASWFALQVVDTVSSVVGLPLWFGKGVVVLLLFGLPVLVLTAFLQQRVVGASAAADIERHGWRRLFTWRNALWSGVGAFALYGLAVGGYTTMRSLGIGPAGTLVARGVLDDRAFVILTRFGSPSGDTLLARAATEALQVDLGRSAVVRLVPPATIAQVLRRMERPPDTPLDLDLAREVGIREGFPAVVAGEITSLGRSFTLTARLVSTQDGSDLVSVRESARDSSAILDAIDVLSERLRERIGESLASLHAEVPLQAVTSNSLEALQKYSLADDALNLMGDGPKGVALLEEAVELDPTFAMAWRRLGVVLMNRGQQSSDAMAALQNAFDHADRLPDLERYGAASSYYMFIGDFEASITSSRTLLDVDPSNVRALNNLGYTYFILRDYEQAEDLTRRAMTLDPLNTFPYATLTNALGGQGRFDEVAALADTARARFGDNFFVELHDAHALWSKGDHAAAESRFLDRRDDRPGDEFWRVVTSIDLAALYAARGRLDEAGDMLESAMLANAERGLGAEYLRNAIWLGLIDVLYRERFDDGVRIVEEALAAYPLAELDPLDAPYLDLSEFYALSGDVERARELIEEYEAAVSLGLRDFFHASHHLLRATNDDRTRAYMALAEGRADDAIESFRRSDRADCSLCPLPGLAQAYEAAGAPDSAIAILERYLATPINYRLWWGDAFHLGPTLERLVDLESEAGNHERAALHFQRLAELWGGADAVLQPRVEGARARLAN